MKNIEIITAQKVDITYPLASVVQRIIAFLIDFVILGVVYWLTFLLLTSVFTYDYSGNMENIIMIILLPWATFYTLFWEVLLHGQTPGKKALNIRVIKLSGQRMEFADYVIRWIFRVVDIWFSSGSVAIILGISSEKRQRLGDILANTAVVQIHGARNYTLNDVMNIMKLKDYEVTYSNAKQFNEQQMLIVKETLERHKRHPNKAHKEALKSLSIKTAKALEVTKIQGSYDGFLRTLLRDYIFLTR